MVFVCRCWKAGFYELSCDVYRVVGLMMQSSGYRRENIRRHVRPSVYGIASAIYFKLVTGRKIYLKSGSGTMSRVKPKELQTG